MGMIDLEAFAAALEDFAQANGLPEACGTVLYATTPEGNPVMATVTVQVTAPAIDEQDDTAATAFNTPVTIPVLANDTDPAGQELIVASVTQPSASQGSVAITADQKQVVFTPAANFFGQAQFSYTAGRA